MVVGRSPFDAEDVTQIYKNIIKGFSKVKFPDRCPSDLIDVVKSLCRKKPEERVPMQKRGVDCLREMSWFSDMAWDRLATRSLDGPFIPEPTNLDKIAKKTLERDFDVDLGCVRDWDGSFDAV